MSITKELRELPSFGSMTIEGKSYDPLREMVCVSRHDLLAIADRIDAEHESACAEAYGSGVMSVPIALDESQWVRLPVDADGEPWRLGDELMMEGEVCEVVGIGGKTIFYAFGDGVEWTIAHNNRHHHAPTVEDVLDEIVDKANAVGVAYASNDMSGDEMMDALRAIIADYASKLRLAGDAE